MSPHSGRAWPGAGGFEAPASLAGAMGRGSREIPGYWKNKSQVWVKQKFVQAVPAREGKSSGNALSLPAKC